MKYSALLVAAGKNAATGQSYEKALASFNESKSVLAQTISVFLNDEQCSQIVIVTNPADMSRIVQSSDSGKIMYVKGGSTRRESVLIGLMGIIEDVVLIHDGVRPWIKQNYINNLLKEMHTEKACVLALKPTGSVRFVEEGYLLPQISHENTVVTQTPQAYNTAFIINCYKTAVRENIAYLDDAEVVSAVCDQKIKVVTGDLRNSRFILKEN